MSLRGAGRTEKSGTRDSFDFRFEATGGLLSFLYPGINLYALVVREASSFAGSFASDFAGSARGKVGAGPPIPEPARALLAALGLAGLAQRVRRR